MNNFTMEAKKRFASTNKRDGIARTTNMLIEDVRVNTIMLDMNSTDPVVTNFKFKQYDYGTSFISAQLMDTDTPLNLSTYTIIGVFRDANGKLIVDTQDNPVKSNARVVIVQEGVVKLSIPKDVLVQNGDIDCEIVLFNGENRMTSPKFTFNIVESMFNHEIIETPTIPICGEAICGEAICGGLSSEVLEEIKIETNLSEEFLERFKSK